jgi:hypothetical protein
VGPLRGAIPLLPSCHSATKESHPEPKACLIESVLKFDAFALRVLQKWGRTVWDTLSGTLVEWEMNVVEGIPVNCVNTYFFDFVNLRCKIFPLKNSRRSRFFTGLFLKLSRSANPLVISTPFSSAG